MDTKLLILSGVPGAHTTADAVAQTLRDGILRGALQAGQPLQQEDLAEQFGVSRIPIREALRQLSAEGLVTLSANRSAVVAALSADEVREIYDIRIGLETTALRLAIPNLSPAILGRAAEILSAIDREADPARWSELNWAFHAALYVPAQRPRLLGLIKTMHDNVARYLRIYLALMNFQDRSQQEHRALLAACERYDTATATQTLVRHLEGASELLVAYLRQERAPAR